MSLDPEQAALLADALDQLRDAADLLADHLDHLGGHTQTPRQDGEATEGQR